ncbi:MAG TPA: tRNA glutamyl-Q(34) synthetase GluQRS [Gaiellales bacterium]|nr:tRNA glutamyl-Q(34) synthetase GluQRS [Gaiellales bacterium]
MAESATRITGRFAPSPSGPMHVGNARTALAAWLDVRARGGRMLLRLEDLDRDRCRPAFADLVRRDLEWLGLDWDAETSPQSTRSGAYDDALGRLSAAGHLYECFCSRRELAVASAPHGAAGRRYAGTCRDLSDQERDARRAAGRMPSLRLRVPDEPVAIHDRLLGVLDQRPARTMGDVVVRRSDGLHSYQLAVVVDDAADGVTEVVRGDDLLPSAGCQAVLQDMLGLDRVTYAHVPLVRGADGERLAKRHGAIAISDLRDGGVGARRLLGWLGRTLGIEWAGGAAAADLLGGFALERIPRSSPVIF